jgi:CRISPR/Cas system Type II protein with McrA/HNH and RuvC-like nuclease domain
VTLLLPTADDYLYNLLAMTSPEAKRLRRQAIKDHWNSTCAYCAGEFLSDQLTIDHVIPKCRGGDDSTQNLIPACRVCNKSKASSDWLTWMRQTFGHHPQREQLINSWIN